MVIFGIFVFVMVFLIAFVSYALVTVGKCPTCRDDDWELVEDKAYYSVSKCKSCGEIRSI
jgi:hypothetical protein